MNATKELVNVKNLQKSFFYPEKLDLLKELNFTLHERQAVAILGASGEGKTTLLHILGMLESFDSGIIEICKKPLSQYDPSFLRKTFFGFIFQTFNLLEDFRVIDNVLMPASILRKVTQKNSPSYERAVFLLQEVGLKEKALYPAKLLSGGEKQRVAIARALMNDPSVILADEPSGSLDAQNSKIVHELLLNCVRKNHKSLILVTHDTELANLCDQRFLLKEGSLKVLP